MAPSIDALRAPRRLAVPEGGVPETGTRLDRVLSALLIMLAAFPYAGIPLGGNTNFPISSFIAGILVLRAARFLPILVIAVLVAGVPFLSAFIRLFLDSTPLEPVATATWIAASLALAGMAAATVFLRERIIPWMSWTLVVSAGYAVLQKHLFIDVLNMVPFSPLYTLPGYANLLPFEETFLTYVRRPFGFFPETSFMVGSVALMAMALIVALRHYGRLPSARDWAAVLLALWAGAVSGSGSAVFVLAAVAAAVLIPAGLRRAPIALLAVPVAAVGSYVVADSVLTERKENFNWSWADRGSSILAVGKRMLEDPIAFWGGLGRGQVNVQFAQNNMPVDTFQHYNRLTDIFSVSGRIIAENGMLIGLTMVLLMSWFLLRSGGRVPLPLGLIHLFVWMVVAGGTISYDNAFWIWGGTGMAIGLHLLRDWPEEPVPERQRIPSLAEVERRWDERRTPERGLAPAVAAPSAGGSSLLEDPEATERLPWHQDPAGADRDQVPGTGPAPWREHPDTTRRED